MKRLPLLVLLLLGSLSVNALSVETYDFDQEKNLVKNYDFEGLGVHPWRAFSEDSSILFRVNIDQNESVTGNQSLVVEILGENRQSEVFLATGEFPVKKGQIFTFSLYAKTEKSREVVISVDKNYSKVDYGWKSIFIGTDWSEFSLPVYITEDGTAEIKINLRDASINGKVWFDAVRFYEEY